MSTVRNPDRADAPSHVAPTPPPKLAPADDPQWAMTLHLADLARAARPTTTEETTMPTTNDPAELARRLDQLSADHVDIFETTDQRSAEGEDIGSEDDEERHQSIGKAAAYGQAAAMVREMFPGPAPEPIEMELAVRPHHCEAWMMRASAKGGRYCGACGRHETPTFPTDGSMETAP